MAISRSDMERQLRKDGGILTLDDARKMAPPGESLAYINPEEAALLKSLDIFITVSNSTAHLAGSLGVKTLLIKPDNYALFHYWNQKNNKTPWYNSVELIERKEFLKKSINLENYLNL